MANTEPQTEKWGYWSRLIGGNKVLWMVLVFLVMFSVIMVYSASVSIASFSTGQYNDKIMEHIRNLIIGLGLTFLFHRLRPSTIGSIMIAASPFLWFALLFATFFGKVVNGAQRSFFGVQPSEFIKISLIVLCAWWIGPRIGRNGLEFKKPVWPFIAIVLAIVFPVFLDNLSNAVLMVLVVLSMLFVARIKFRYIAYLFLGAVAAFSVCVTWLHFSPDTFPVKRAQTWYNRFARASEEKVLDVETYHIDDKSYQIDHARMAVAGSRIVGKGFAAGEERNHLPQAYSDYIFSIIIEETGIFGSSCVIIAYLCMLIFAFRIALQCEDRRYGIMMVGCALMIFYQAMIHMSVGVAMGGIVTGQPLPMISRGGSSLFTVGALFGIMISISRYVEESSKKQEKAKPQASEDKVQN